jgi:hypothetical protein
MKAITVVISCLFAAAMTDALMRIAPWLQAAVDVVCIRVHTRARCTCRLNQRLACCLLDIGKQPNHHFATALAHPEERRLLRYECAASARALEPPAPATPPFFTTAAGFPLCPATISTSSHSTASLQVGAGFFDPIPWRNCLVI